MSKGLADLASAVQTTAPVVEKKKAVETAKALTLDDKWKALKAVEAKLNKQFDTTNSLVRLGSRIGIPVPSFSTGLPTFDYDVLGCGGIPRGRVIEVFGPESSGKTTSSLHFIACDQRNGNLAAFVDAEHALDPSYAAKIGVDVDNLLVSQPDSGEQALETVGALIESRAVSTIVVDSVAALVPQAELDGEFGDSHMGLHARLMSQAMRKLVGAASKNGVTVIFINQIREKVGVSFGNPEVTTGGRALKFYSSVRLEVRKVAKSNGGDILSGDVLVGHKMRFKAVKNKVGAPFRETFVELIYGVGIDTLANQIEWALDNGIIAKSGAWFEIPGFDRVQGRDSLKELVRDNDKARGVVEKGIAAAREAQLKADAPEEKQ